MRTRSRLATGVQVHREETEVKEGSTVMETCVTGKLELDDLRD